MSSIVAASAARHSARTAIVDDDRTLTFLDLAERAHRLANVLLGQGLQPGDRVVDLQNNSHTYIETDLALAIAGLVRVPVNTRLTVEEWVYIAQDADARGLVYSGEHLAGAEALMSEADLRCTIRVGTEGPGFDYEDSLHGASRVAPSNRPQPGDVVSLNYSSGTTGKPKGCIRTAANRHASMQDMLLGVFGGQLRPNHVFYHAGPITHASGLFVLPCLAAGATQVIGRRFDEEVVADRLRNGVSGTVLVPTMLERVMAVLDGTSPVFPHLRWLTYAGAPMAPDRIRFAGDLFSNSLTQFYGMVEAIPPLTVLTASDHDRDDRLKSAGQPVAGAALEIWDDEGHRVPVGEVGEVVVGGSHVMGGYWHNHEATTKTLASGWLRTGDLGWVDADGYLYLVDRRADMIISGGFNVMPREVEGVVLELDGVAEAAVVGLPDPTWGEAVTAFVVREPTSRVQEEDVLEHCRLRLSKFKKPKAVIFVEELPRSSTGKVSRKALRHQQGQIVPAS